MGSEAHWMGGAEGGGFLQNPSEVFSHSDFRLLAEHLPHMVWICRPDGTLDYMNSHWLRYFGPTLRDCTRLFPSGAIAHPDDREHSRSAWEHALRVEEALTIETRLQRSDGVFRWHTPRDGPVSNRRSPLPPGCMGVQYPHEPRNHRQKDL